LLESFKAGGCLWGNGFKTRASSCLRKRELNVISLLLAGWLAAPSYGVKANLSNTQVRQRAHQIVQLLRRQDPRVLRSVMYYMEWVPRVKYTRENCKKNKIKTQPDPVMDMLMNEAGIKRKRR